MLPERIGTMNHFLIQTLGEKSNGGGFHRDTLQAHMKEGESVYTHSLI